MVILIAFSGKAASSYVEPADLITAEEYAEMIITLGFYEVPSWARKDYTDEEIEEIQADERLKLRSPDFKDIFSHLEIKVSKNEMHEIFERDHVILNRKPVHETLVIGCGNLPQDENYSPRKRIEEISGKEKNDIYYAAHQHINEDTIDIDHERNPTMVGSIFTLPLEIFKGHKYKRIISEGFPILPTDSRLSKDSSSIRIKRINALLKILALLNDDGRFIFLSNLDKYQYYSAPKATLERYVDAWRENTEEPWLESMYGVERCTSVV